MRAPSIAFYVALLIATHIFRIKLLSLLALLVAVGVSVAWRFLRLFKLQLRAPPHAAAFVSGATSGIGLETAVQFARSGLLTFAGCRNVNDAGDLLKAAGAASNMIVPVECDVTSTTSVSECANLIREEMEKRQILGLYACTLNAGVMRCVPTEISDDLEQRETFETNYFGVVRCIQVFTPMLRYYADRSKDRAHLNIVSSVLGLFSGPGYAPYACSKFALEALSDSLRPELSLWNIHVSTYEFAAIESDVCDKINKEVYDVNSMYYTFRTNWRKFLMATRTDPAPADEAAKHILANVFSRFPASRVVFGKPMELAVDAAMILMPDRIRDFAMLKALRM